MKQIAKSLLMESWLNNNLLFLNNSTSADSQPEPRSLHPSQLSLGIFPPVGLRVHRGDWQLEGYIL